MGTRHDLTLTKERKTSVVGVEFGAEKSGGVVLTNMSKEGAGFSAGLRPGDVLVAVNGVACESEQHAAAMLRTAEAGSSRSAPRRRPRPTLMRRGAHCSESRQKVQKESKIRCLGSL